MKLDTSEAHKDMDYDEHIRTYRGFIRLTQISIALLIILLGGMYLFLV